MDTVCMLIIIINKHFFRKKGIPCGRYVFEVTLCKLLSEMLTPVRNKHLVWYAMTSSFIIAQLVQSRLGLQLGMTLAYPEGKRYLWKIVANYTAMQSNMCWSAGVKLVGSSNLNL